MTEPREFCESCQRWLAHDQRYCPLFPDVEPPRVARRVSNAVAEAFGIAMWEGAPGEKWGECCCLTHTCYDAPKRDRATAPEYRDFCP